MLNIDFTVFLSNTNEVHSVYMLLVYPLLKEANI